MIVMNKQDKAVATWVFRVDYMGEIKALETVLVRGDRILYLGARGQIVDCAWTNTYFTHWGEFDDAKSYYIRLLESNLQDAIDAVANCEKKLALARSLTWRDLCFPAGGGCDFEIVSPPSEFGAGDTPKE